LFFLLADELASDFSRTFGDAFDRYACHLSEHKFGSEAILSEESEAALGWTGKNNDLTIVDGDTSVLFECKTSALFSRAKQTASLDAVRLDICKNIVGHTGKKGLFQFMPKGDTPVRRILEQLADR
jgi:hypothetical protein